MNVTLPAQRGGEHRHRHRCDTRAHWHLLALTPMGSAVPTLTNLPMHTRGAPCKPSHTPASRTELSQLGQTPSPARISCLPTPANRAGFPLETESGPLWEQSPPVRGLQESTLSPLAAGRRTETSQILQDPHRPLTPGLAMPVHSRPALSYSAQAGIQHPALDLLPVTLTTAWGQPGLLPLRQDRGSLLLPWRALEESTGMPLLLRTGQVPHGASHSSAISLFPLGSKGSGQGWSICRRQCCHFPWWGNVVSLSVWSEE